MIGPYTYAPKHAVNDLIMVHMPVIVVALEIGNWAEYFKIAATPSIQSKSAK